MAASPGMVRDSSERGGARSQPPLTDADFQAAMDRECSHFERRAFESRDGTILQVQECGPAEAPPLLIVNPVGVPVLIGARLARALARDHRVITWEQRGTSGSADEFFRRPHEFGAFLGDFLEIHAARAQGVACPLVGICSGAALIVRALARRMVPSGPVVLVSPMLPRARDYSPSQFELTVVPYLRAIAAGNQAIAAQLLQLARAPAPASESESESESADDMRLIQATDKAGMRSPEALAVYAAVVARFTGQMFDDDLQHIGGASVHIVSALNDKMVSADSIRKLAKLLPDARLREYPLFGHHSVFLDERVRHDITQDLAIRRS